MNETWNRHQIMQDSLFWTRLAYHACGWLQDSGDESLRGFWIDDFRPESAAGTKRGADVEGTAWVGDGPRTLSPYRFIASVAQKLLHRQERNYCIEQLVLDKANRTLQMQIA